jgi:hypothetical protein
MQDIDALASTLVIDKQGALSEVMLRLPGFYERLDSPNKVLVKLLTYGVGQILSGQIIAKVQKCFVCDVDRFRLQLYS